MSIIKTGEVFDRDEDGQIWLCESFENTETGEVHSTRTVAPDAETPTNIITP